MEDIEDDEECKKIGILYHISWHYKPMYNVPVYSVLN